MLSKLLVALVAPLQNDVPTLERLGHFSVECIHCPNPDYTDAARGAGFQGSVKFDVVVDEQGKAKRIAVIQGDSHRLTAEATEAIKGWEFKPAMRDGQPVTVCVPIEVVFRLF